jgi:hypothetical protein
VARHCHETEWRSRLNVEEDLPRGPNAVGNHLLKAIIDDALIGLRQLLN